MAARAPARCARCTVNGENCHPADHPGECRRCGESGHPCIPSLCEFHTEMSNWLAEARQSETACNVEVGRQILLAVALQCPACSAKVDPTACTPAALAIRHTDMERIGELPSFDRTMALAKYGCAGCAAAAPARRMGFPDQACYILSDPVCGLSAVHAEYEKQLDVCPQLTNPVPGEAHMMDDGSVRTGPMCMHCATQRIICLRPHCRTHKDALKMVSTALEAKLWEDGDSYSIGATIKGMLVSCRHCSYGSAVDNVVFWLCSRRPDLGERVAQAMGYQGAMADMDAEFLRQEGRISSREFIFEVVVQIVQQGRIRQSTEDARITRLSLEHPRHPQLPDQVFRDDE